jgi:hypothetical protein
LLFRVLIHPGIRHTCGIRIPGLGPCDADFTSMSAGSRIPHLHSDCRHRRFSPLFYVFLRPRPVLLDTRCNSCLSLLAGRRAAALGLRATCTRRAASSTGLLATSFGGLHHFKGSMPDLLFFWVIFYLVFAISTLDVLAHSLILGSVHHLYTSYIYVLFLTPPHLRWQPLDGCGRRRRMRGSIGRGSARRRSGSRSSHVWLEEGCNQKT